MSLVLDSSVTLAWVLPDERHPAIDALWDRVVSSRAWVPSLWRLEVANSLTMAMRRGRISADFRADTLADLALLNIQTDPDTGSFAWRDTLALADTHGLSVYDAAYLELALRLSLPLATLDGALNRAAERCGVARLPAS